MIQHRTAARRIVVSLSDFAYHKMLYLLPNRGSVGFQGLKRTIKKLRPTSKFVPEKPRIHFQMKISDLSAITNQKKVRFSSNSIFKLHSSTFYLQTALLKFYLQTVFFKIYLQTAFFKFYLQASISEVFFRQIVQFQVIKNLLKNSKIK